MTNSKNLGVAMVALIIAIGAYFFPTGNTVVERVAEKLGAVSTLDGVDSPYVTIAGVSEAYVSRGINATSSILCSIPNPYQSTSTISRISVSILDGILGANAYSVSTSTTQYGSSTPAIVLNHNVPSNSIDGMAWYPTGSTTVGALVPISSATGETNYILKPTEYLNVRLATTTDAGPLTDYYDGQCSVEFDKI